MMRARRRHRAILADAILRSLLRRADLMGMAATTYYTAEMVRALPDDGNRYEVVHGELLVTPSPQPLHQLVLQRLQFALGTYLERERVGQLFASPVDISWGPDILVQPDLFVVAMAEARTLDWSRMRTLFLAVEALSPSSVRADRFTKRRLYQEQGAGAYWLVDADARSVDDWKPDTPFPTIETNQLTWHPTGADSGCSLALSALFRPL